MQRALLMLTALAVLAGCPRQPDEPMPVVELEPLFITILKTGDKVEVKDFDQPELFARGQAQFEAGELTEARKTYLLMAKESPNREVQGIAWFNVALCEMAMDRPGAARDAVAKARPLLKEESALSHLRLIELKAMAGLGEWDAVAAQAPEMSGLEMEPEWLAQVQMLAGRSRFQAGKLAEADQLYVASTDTILNNISLEDQYGSAMLAELYFRRGQVTKRLYDGLKFKLPVSRMTVDMSDKMALLRQAEEHFLNAVRTRNNKWSPRAGFQNAALYYGFALDLLQAEVPTDLTDEEMAIYQEELNKKVLPLLRKSQNIHGNNANMCQTFKFTSPWCDKSKTRKAEVEEFEKNLLR